MAQTLRCGLRFRVRRTDTRSSRGRRVVRPQLRELRELELVFGEEDFSCLGTDRGADDTVLLEQVHQASGPGEAHLELALEHRGRSELGGDHQLAGLQVELVVGATVAGRAPATAAAPLITIYWYSYEI